VDHNYIATGYEKHRSDYSLLIWDLSTALGAVPADGNANWQRPLDRLEVTNALARDATRLNPSEPRHIQHYCPSETVNDLAFLPDSYTLLASANGKSIRLYDLRAPGPSGGNASPRDPTSVNASGAGAQWQTRAVNGLTPDPTHLGRFASYETSPGGSLSTVRLWDSRRAAGELASFDVRSGVLGLEWVSGGAGYAKLGVGTRDGVSVWDIIDGREANENGLDEWTTIGDVRNSKSISRRCAKSQLSNQSTLCTLLHFPILHMSVGPMCFLSLRTAQ
jgi:WD40 repeat protein